MPEQVQHLLTKFSTPEHENNSVWHPIQNDQKGIKVAKLWPLLRQEWWESTNRNKSRNYRQLTDKNGKTTAIVLFPVIKSVEEWKYKKGPTETYKVKNEVFKVKYTLVEVNSILETEEKVTELENIAI